MKRLNKKVTLNLENNLEYLTPCIFLFLGLCLALSVFIFLDNALHSHYPAFLYITPNLCLLPITLLLIGTGLRLVGFDEKSVICRTLSVLTLLFFAEVVILIMATAIQLTPFKTIDAFIYHVDKTIFHLDVDALVNWTTKHPYIQQVLLYAYASLDIQLLIIPLLWVINVKKHHEIKIYSLLLLISALIGFIIYYCYPTTAPATLIRSSHFMEEQFKTGLKFWQIHHYIVPSDSDGGLIAFPSFHVIWAVLLLLLVKSNRFAFYALLPLNILLILSCVLLGWHYISDVVMALFIVALSHLCMNAFCKLMHFYGPPKRPLIGIKA